MPDPVGGHGAAPAFVALNPNEPGGGIAALLVGFSEAVDHLRDPAGIAAKFTQDGLFHGNKELRGREAIEAFYRDRRGTEDPRRTTRHTWTSLRGQAVDETTVDVQVILATYIFDPAVSESEITLRMGDVSARCVLQDGEWLFASHVFKRTFTMSLPLSGPPPQR